MITTAIRLGAIVNIYQGMMILQYCQRFTAMVIVNSDPEMQITQTDNKNLWMHQTCDSNEA